ncbi:MAG TPA: ATP-binding cassette domain-containing protein, partial [Symbiobacteriaceae bacterium]|nr:ATP-binding cassette domain-containing protein [Symbiobacteriaceae bacterium]
MLRLKNVSASYGKIRALQNVSLEVPDGKIVTLLGANGAGKTSTLKVITGLLQPTGGTVEFAGHDLAHRGTASIIPLGIAISPEGRQIFTHLTVSENLRLGAYTRKDGAGVRKDYSWVLQLFPRLSERINQVAGTLS